MDVKAQHPLTFGQLIWKPLKHGIGEQIMTQIESISSRYETKTLLDQLAEEATELAHAALKASRIMRGENPTPVNIREAESKLVEEWTDLCLVADVMGLNLDEDIYDGKLNRWTARLNEVRNDSKGISSAT